MRTKPSQLLLAAFVLCLSLGCGHRGPHSVTLSWEPPRGVLVAGYNVYRSTTSDGEFVELATRVPAPPYQDRLVLSGRTYFYVVTAVDQAGHESRFSAETQATIP